uniref:Cyclin C-terminal domain-containing protein n=1 Tax=Glossina palpalis gambiensis TaxID=67801 RepID=A0A1B0B6I6_9MUSC
MNRDVSMEYFGKWIATFESCDGSSGGFASSQTHKWELFVLSRLGWDLSCVTPLDFLELLLIRLPIRSTKYPDLEVDKVRQHAQAFISLAAKEHNFSVYTASTIAASSIAAALSGLNWHLRTGLST